jgi:hypothetical protein
MAMPGLAAGVYLIRAVSDGEVETTRFAVIE